MHTPPPPAEDMPDSVYRDHLADELQEPSRRVVLSTYSSLITILLGLALVWLRSGDGRAPERQLLRLSLREDTEISDANFAPPPPPPPPPSGPSVPNAAHPSLLEENPADPKPRSEFKVLDPSQVTPAIAGGVIGGVPGGTLGGEPGGVLGGTVGGKKGGVIGGHPGGTGAALALVPPKVDAVYHRNPPPNYPIYCRRAQEAGTVQLRVLVQSDGRVEQVEIRASSGFPRLDAAAEEAVRRWIFTPARRGSEAVAAWVIVPITFSLE